MFPMQQLSIRHLFVGACATLLVAPVALAQSSQHLESDLDLNSIDNELTSMQRMAY
ncbi:MAG: hypothetical protein P8X81_11755 [Woeseiaceae bacterium]